MTEPKTGQEPIQVADDEISMLAMAIVLLRWRRVIVALGLGGALLGLGIALLGARVYVATATFIPQASDAAASGLALAASQFGIRVPSSAATWGPPIYVELLGSEALLEPIALDTVVVVEDGSKHVALMDLLKIKGPTLAIRRNLAVRALRRIVQASEDRKLGAVKLAVTTEWPSVSLSLAERLVSGVNQFNIKTRKLQVAAEREFVEAQAGDAERALREAENGLQSFLQRNRTFASSPELTFERDRLQREVSLRQQVYTSLVQNREESRFREVRDTPVITVLAAPLLPVQREGRKSVQKTVLGGLLGGLLAIVFAFFANGVADERRAKTERAREFFQLAEEIRSRRGWLRR